MSLMIRHKGIWAGATASLAPPRAASAFGVANTAICAAALDKVAAVAAALVVPGGVVAVSLKGPKPALRGNGDIGKCRRPVVVPESVSLTHLNERTQDRSPWVAASSCRRGQARFASGTRPSAFRAPSPLRAAR